MMETTTVMNNNECPLTAKNCTFIWKISNFSNRCKAVGESIMSPIFTAGNLVSDKIKWHLILYPFGNKDENKDYLSLFLKCILSDDIVECEMSLIFDLWDDNNKMSMDSYSDNSITCNPKSKMKGYAQFICRNSDELKNHLTSSENNTLSIACFIRNITPHYTAGSYHYIELIRGFDSIFLSENLSDVTIEVDNKTLKAHKIILSARSEVFSAMFKHNLLEYNEGVIKVEDINYDAMKEVLRFIYCGKVENLDLHKRDLLAAATKYDLDSLKNYCEEAFWKDFSIDNICEILSIADLYECKKLKTGAIKFIIENIKKSFETSEFFELIDAGPNLLIDFFQSTVLKKSLLRKTKIP